MSALKKLEAYFNEKINTRDDLLSKFKNDLSENPNYALNWSFGVMQATARAAVAARYLGSIVTWRSLKAEGKLAPEHPQTEEAAVEFIRERILREAIQRNAIVQHSSNPCSNFMRLEENAFYAYLINEWSFITLR